MRLTKVGRRGENFCCFLKHLRKSRLSMSGTNSPIELWHVLDTARLMLDHGADPNFDEAADGAGPNSGGGGTGPVAVSTRIFEKLLKPVCCESTPLIDCSCLSLGRARTKLTELAELVEQKKPEKRLGPLKHRGRVGKRVAKLGSSTKRILKSRQQALDNDMPNDDRVRSQLTAVPRSDL